MFKEHSTVMKMYIKRIIDTSSLAEVYYNSDRFCFIAAGFLVAVLVLLLLLLLFLLRRPVLKY